MKKELDNQENANNYKKNYLGFFKKPIIFLVIIGAIGLGIRLYYFPDEIPLVRDALSYFWYSIDLSVTGEFPSSFDSAVFKFPNNGWPMFLSLFFSVLDSQNYLDFMNLQRYLSIAISVITIVPVYFLSKRYFDEKISLIAPTIFIFHPLIIENSLLGITEPLFIILVTTMVYLFLSNRYKIIILSFVLAGLCAVVRYEGLIFILPLSVLFIFRHRNETKFIFKYLLLLGVFILILLPVAYIRIDTIGNDGLVSNVFNVGNYFVGSVTNTNEIKEVQGNVIKLGFYNLGIFLGIISMPILIFLVPFGLMKMIIKEKTYLNYALIFFGLTSLLVAMYAYSRDIQETRYLLVLIPGLSLISIFLIDKITRKFNKRNRILILFFSIILVSSWIYVDFGKVDYEYESDAANFAKLVYEKTDIINGYHPQDQYLRPIIADFSDEFPNEKKFLSKPIKIFESSNFNSIEEFISSYRENGLEYIVVDDERNRPDFIKDIFNNEEKFPFLEKVFDSNVSESKYKVKLFLINYNEFGEI